MLYDPGALGGYAGFARPLEVLLGRDDLRIQLLWVLDRIERTDEPPDREIILRALSALEIEEGRYQEVELALMGDLTATIRRLRPVVELLAGPSASARVARAQTYEEVEAALDGVHPQVGASVLMEQARGVSNDRDMGLWLYGAIGDEAELERWNAALVRLGSEYRPISNIKNLREELEDYRRELRVALRSIARSVVADGAAYVAMRDALDKVPLPPDLELKRWVLTFREAASILMGPVAPMVPPKLLAGLSDASAIDRFVAVLGDAGLEPTIDPAEIDGENARSCRATVKDLARAAIVWCDRRKLASAGWAEVDGLIDAVLETIRLGRGYLDRFDSTRAFNETRKALPRGTKLPANGPYATLWVALDAASSVAALLERLEVSRDELAKAGDVLRLQEEEARRRRRLVSIAGSEFDTASDNLGGLFEHIQSGAAPAAPLDVLSISELVSIGKRRKPGSSLPHGHGGSPPSSGKRPRYRSQEVKDAIALAGEIHAYRWLQATYGSAVTPSCWISSLSLHRLPSNAAQDGAGCDFRVKLPDGGVLLHLEVKATEGWREEFELGVTEVALATAVLKRNRRKKELFRILHVLDVFSATPTPVLLPNPYDPGQDLIELAATGVQMSYRRAKGS